MKLLRKTLILAHRYLGIVFSLLVMVWFGSGIVMMYAGGMPRLSPELRLERMPDLDLSRMRLTPADASAAAGADRGAPEGRRGGPGGRGGGSRIQLLSVMDRPAYRVGGVTVFADTGDTLQTLTLDQARSVASQFVKLPGERIAHATTVTHVDQWTLGQSRALPLYKFRVDDTAGTELYVQPRTGEITNLTTRRTRALAWVGTIPHWLYFAALRENQPLWYQIVVWTSGAVCVLTVLGLALALTQWRRTRPFRLSRSIPYAGWMRWHYITGAVFGVFTLTWAFSGLLSMEPFAWTNATGLRVRRDVFTGGSADLSAFKTLDAATWSRVLDGRAIKEIEFTRIQGEDYYAVRLGATASETEKQRERLHQPYYVTGRSDPDRVLVHAGTLAIRHEPFSADALLARLRPAAPGVDIAESALLTDYDAYYYSRARQTPLPVLRVKFKDPAETWVYIDPEMGQVLAEIHRLARVERWLYNGLHSLDFPFWYNRRPLWDVVMIVLLTGGLASSFLGFIMGIRRMRRAVLTTVSARPGPRSAPGTTSAGALQLAARRASSPPL